MPEPSKNSSVSLIMASFCFAILSFSTSRILVGMAKSTIFALSTVCRRERSVAHVSPIHMPGRWHDSEFRPLIFLMKRFGRMLSSVRVTTSPFMSA